MDVNRTMRQILRLFPLDLRDPLAQCRIFERKLEEIRVRVGGYLMFRTAEGEYFLKGNKLCRTPEQGCRRMSAEDIAQMCSYMSRYSLYAYEEEIRQGFLTVEGGHRVGVCGQVSLEHGRIRRLAPISYLNIRVAHECKGCAGEIYPLLHENGRFCNTLILSSPGAGKTTLLRDLVRMLSDGSGDFAGQSIGLVDERSEIAGSVRGIPQNDVGIRTDVLDGCPKAEGMMLLVRSMSPRILAVDEIGGADDLASLVAASHCGCRILATVHCRNLAELWEKPEWHEVKEQKLFSKFVMIEVMDAKREFRVVSKKSTD